MRSTWVEPKQDGQPKDYVNGVWQYIVDHSQIVGNENPKYRAVLYVKDRKDFEWRVKARMKGVYRNDEKQMDDDYQKFLKEMVTWKYEQKLNKGMQEVTNRIDKEGSLIEKTILYIYRVTRNYLKKDNKPRLKEILHEVYRT